MKLRAALVATAWLVACAGSPSNDPASASALASASASPAPLPASAAPSGEPSPPPVACVAPPAPPPRMSSSGIVQGSGRQAVRLAPGSSCAGFGVDEIDSAPKNTSVKGSKVVVKEKWGCGCPTRPTFTLVYRPGTSPLEGRICVDVEADRCEAFCSADLEWDLTAVLAAEGATTIRMR